MQCELTPENIKNGLEKEIDTKLMSSNLFQKEGNEYKLVDENSQQHIPLILSIQKQYKEAMVLPTDNFENSFHIAEPSKRLINSFMNVTVDIQSTDNENYNENKIYQGSTIVGKITMFNDGSYLNVNDVDVTIPKLGIGTKLYIYLGNWANQNGLQLRSDIVDVRMNDASKGLWESLKRKGLATFDGQRYIFTGNNIFLSAAPTNEELAQDITNSIYKEAFLQDPEQFLKEIGEQLADPLSRNTAIKIVGERIAKLAEKPSGKELSSEQLKQFEEFQKRNLIVYEDGKYIIPNPNAKSVLKGILAARGIDWIQISNNKVVLGTIPNPTSTDVQVNEGIRSKKIAQITKNRVLKFLDNIGFRNIQILNQLVYQGKKLADNAYTDLINAVMQIKDGLEDYVLPEESMHILVALIKQSSPELYARLMKDIVNYKMYGAVLNYEGYNNRKDDLYKNENGSLDYTKIKEEAVAKLLAEYLINSSEGTGENMENTYSLWEKIKQWIQTVFGLYKNPFKEALDALNDSDTVFGYAGDITEDDVFLSAKPLEKIDEENPISKEIFEEIKNRPEEENFNKIGSDYYKDGKQVTYTDDELQSSSTQTLQAIATSLNISFDLDSRAKDDENKKYLISRITKDQADRVSNLAGKYYNKLFSNRNFDESLREFYEQSRKDGDYIHQIMESVLKSWIDPQTGLMRKDQETVIFPQGNPITGKVVKTLSSYIRRLMAEYSQGTRFLVEQIIYDKENDRYGTIDFMAVLPDGTVDIFDWKSMLLEDLEGAKDYKREGIYIQMNEYKRILKDQYGITLFGKIRAIPIRKNYIKEKDSEVRKLNAENPLEIGNPVASKIKDDERYLRPIISPEESTGDPYRDMLITKLDRVYQDYINKKAFKNNRTLLNEIRDSIYELRVSNTSENLARYFIDLKLKIESLLKEKDVLKTKDNVSEALGVIRYYQDIINNLVKPSLEKKDTPEFAKMAEAAKDVQSLDTDLNNLRNELVELKAKQAGIFGLLLPEKVVSFAARTFRSIGSQAMATTRFAYELVNKSYSRIDFETDNEIKNIKGLKANIDKWMEETKTSSKDMIAKLVNFNSGAIHSKIDTSFYTERDKVRTSNNKTQIIDFVKNNYDMEVYVEDYNKNLNELKQRHKETTYDIDPVEDSKIKRRNIHQFEKNFDIFKHPITAFGKHNPLIFNVKNLIESNWESKEYKELKNNEPLLKMYEYMVNKNKELVDAGVLEDYKAYTFFPNVRKGMADLLSIDDTSVLSKTTDLIAQQYKTFRASLSVDDYHLNFQGKINPVTGEALNERFVPYVDKIDNDFKLKVKIALQFNLIRDSEDTTELGTKIEKFKSESPENKEKFEKELLNSRQMSFDIFSVYGLMAKEVAKEKYLQENDEMLKALVYVEKGKKSIKTNQFSNIIYKASGEPDIDDINLGKNLPTLEPFIKAIVNGETLQFGQDYEITLKIREKWNKSWLGKLHKFDVESKDYNPTHISAAKTIMWLNQANQKRILGVNFASAISNMFGGAFAANKLYQKYASKADLHKAWAKMTSCAFYQSDDMKKNAALFDYFLPLLNNREGFKASQLSVNDAAKFMSRDWLMAPMRTTSEKVQSNIFFAVIENTGVINGKIVNLRIEAANNAEYKNRFNVSSSERAKLEKQFEDRIKEYREKYSFVKFAQFKTIQENGKDKVIIDIPGISRDSKDVTDLRELIQTMSKDALGEADAFDKANYSYSIGWRMFMTFKNWIPRQADVRFGEFRPDQAHHSYEYGRIRMFAKSLSGNLLMSLAKAVPLPYITGKVTDAVFGKEALIQRAKEDYQEKLKQEKVLGRYNEETFISEEEFIEKFIQGVDSSFAEIRTGLFMVGLLLFGICAPDDDDDDADEKAWKVLARRQINKLIDEVGFFYSPKSAIDIGGGGIPFVSFVKDTYYTITNITEQTLGFTLENAGFEETGIKLQDSAKPAKRIFKMFPVLKEILTYLPAINEDVAKEWGIKITDQRAQ